MFVNKIWKTTEDVKIPISLVRQYLFCPRIPYYTFILGIKPSIPLWVKQGTDFHNNEVRLFKRRVLNKFGINDPNVNYELSLESKTLKLYGVCDLALIDKNNGAIVEFKLDKRSLHRGAYIQLAAYSIALEEMYGVTVNTSFFVVGTRCKSIPIKIDQKLRNQLFETVEKMQKILDYGLLPHSSANEVQCGQCEFITRCNDRD